MRKTSSSVRPADLGGSVGRVDHGAADLGGETDGLLHVLDAKAGAVGPHEGESGRRSARPSGRSRSGYRLKARGFDCSEIDGSYPRPWTKYWPLMTPNSMCESPCLSARLDCGVEVPAQGAPVVGVHTQFDHVQLLGHGVMLVGLEAGRCSPRGEHRAIIARDPF